MKSALLIAHHSAGYTGGTFDSGNAYYEFVTQPQIYSPTAAEGQRWSNPLTDAGIDRGYHNSALLIASGEVCHIVNMELSRLKIASKHTSTVFLWMCMHLIV